MSTYTYARKNVVTIGRMRIVLGWTAFFINTNKLREGRLCVSLLHERMNLVCQHLSKQSLLPCHSPPSKVPWTDVLLLQEVFSVSTGSRLATLLSSQYPYCLYNVAQHSIAANRCCLGQWTSYTNFLSNLYMFKNLHWTFRRGNYDKQVVDDSRLARTQGFFKGAGGSIFPTAWANINGTSMDSLGTRLTQGLTSL